MFLYVKTIFVSLPDFAFTPRCRIVEKNMNFTRLINFIMKKGA